MNLVLIDNPFVPYVERFECSSEFSYLANYFYDNDVYTNLLEGTIEYVEFWKDVKDKCIHGITNSKGISITGPHFFYLNFCQILGYNKKTGKKSMVFPTFVDLDYEFFHMVEYCRLNQKCLTAVKGRRQGWSYKAASLCSHELSFYPDSRSVIGAFFSNFSQNTMSMAIDNLNFLNANTEFRKQRNPDLKDYVMAKYQATIGNVKVWKGYKSSIKAISFKDNPTAAVGLSANWLILDEAGVFNNIVDSYGYTEPLIKDGSRYTGVALVFGSSGNMDSGSKYFYEMFINPGKYNMLEFTDPDNEGKKVCYFSSAAKGRWGNCLDPDSIWFNKPMVDEEGNSNIEAATDDILFLRHKSKNSTDPKSLHSVITQFPLSWKEAFLRDKGTIFASIEMLDWLGKLETTPSLSNDKKKVELYFDNDNKIKAKLSPDLEDIVDYPLGKNVNKTGCVVIWEDPVADSPWGLYIAGCLLPGEKVLTNKGLMNIEDVTLDHQLINKEGELVNIINLQRYEKENEDVYEITVSNTYRTTVFTQEHPIYISDNILNSDKTINEKSLDFKYVKVKDIKEKQWIKYPNIYNKENLNNNIPYLNLNTDIEEYNNNFWWFIGLWLGDGWCESNGCNISIAFNINDKYYIEKTKNIINLFFNKKPQIRIRNNCLQISFSCKELNSWLTDNFGKYAYGKYIPEWAKYISKDYKYNLINGYLASDGAVCKNKKYYTTEFVSINLELLESIQDILFSLNIVSGISKLRNKGEAIFRNKISKTKECYHLRLNTHSTIKLKNKLDINDPKLDKVDLNIKLRKEPKDGCFISDCGNYIYFKIRNIKKSKYTGTVYNFECETHTYMCHHINTHNCDPYDQDKADSSESLGSFFVYKRFISNGQTYDTIVAEFTGRPERADDFYETCRKLCIYYNAKCLYENQLKGLKGYFEQKNSLHYLAEQPQIIKDIVKDSKVSRGYGIHMNRGNGTNSGIKDQCEIYLKQWLYEERDTVEGQKILNLHTIKSIPLLKELIAYDRDTNTDRVIAFMLCILQKQEMHKLHLENSEPRTILEMDSFFSKKLFQKNIHNKINY